MSEQKKSGRMICITCPVGCTIYYKTDQNGRLICKGNRCPRGNYYVQTELFSPKRTLTTTVKIRDSHLRLPVKSASPIPKHLLFECMEELKKQTVSLPVTCGDTICEFHDIAIVAARSAAVHPSS